MLISKNLIAKRLPKFASVSDEQFAEACNSVGMEVERVTKNYIPEGLIVGTITRVDKHPYADKLSVCTVDVGLPRELIIVCGAPNVQANKKVIVALQDTVLFDGKRILNREVRTVMSEGMLCGYGEITPNIETISKDDKHGIIIMDDAQVGDRDIAKYLGLDDTQYEVTIPSNRNDLNGLIPFCQEIAKFFKWDFKVNEEIERSGKEVRNDSVDGKNCFALTTTIINDVKIEQSDWTVKKILMSNGVSPINNAVDNLSYITLHTNVPSAAYDFDKLPSEQLIVKPLDHDETIVGIDGCKYDLKIGDLVVYSGNTIVSVAGIIGVEGFKVDENTKNILVEFANFNHLSVRSTAVRLDINTDAAKRFSKPIANWLVKKSVDMLLEYYENAKCTETYFDDKIGKIEIDFDALNVLLDVNLSRDEILSGLEKSGFDISGDRVSIPQYRRDIHNQQDIFEEVLKFCDINKLTSKPICAEVSAGKNSLEHCLVSQVKDVMIENYFQETKNYNLCSEKEVNHMNVFRFTPKYKIDNCNNKNREYLRLDLLGSMLRVYEYNNSYKNKLQPIFELQKIYSLNKFTNVSAICEKNTVVDGLNGSRIIYNVAGLRAVADEIAKTLNTKFEYFAANDNEFFYQNEMLVIHCEGHVVGYIGNIKQGKLKNYSLNGKTIYALTLNVEAMIKNYQEQKIILRPFSNYAVVARDISFNIESYEKIKDAVKAINELSFISQYEFIDQYREKNGTISYTIRVKFDNTEKISTEQIDEYSGVIVNTLMMNQCNVKR